MIVLENIFMAHAFPEKSVEPAQEMAKRYFEFQGNKDSLLKRAYMIFYGFGEQSRYGFTHQFYTGNYAPWFHEMQEKNISQYNCTTIVPYLYTYFEAFGVKPEIVQFFDSRLGKYPAACCETLITQRYIFL